MSLTIKKKKTTTVLEDGVLADLRHSWRYEPALLWVGFGVFWGCFVLVLLSLLVRIFSNPR